MAALYHVFRSLQGKIRFLGICAMVHPPMHPTGVLGEGYAKVFGLDGRLEGECGGFGDMG